MPRSSGISKTLNEKPGSSYTPVPSSLWWYLHMLPREYGGGAHTTDKQFYTQFSKFTRKELKQLSASGNGTGVSIKQKLNLITKRN